MHKDRGTIKWTSLMLPEHVEKLKHMWADEYDVNQPPLLDEQQLEDMNRICAQAYHNKTIVQVTAFDQHETKHFTGTITRINEQRQTFTITTPKENVMIPFSSIIHIE
ncbi:YolD-like family protein [Salirhabdus salicampi]|uniref:YolD-like family protein n=1 Tax=Salirhabdus salicampi TaxID=476102 RepID=UPI0020C46449|nr:YolD-like family protein [Salirhabdus salicampi]MCP8616095.1 YolD-like family protein [Salirhabdus salicampi]